MIHSALLSGRPVVFNCYLPCLPFHCLPLLRAQLYLFMTPWTAAHQAPLFTEFPRQEYWSGLPFPTPEDPPNPGIKLESLASPAFEGGSSILLIPQWRFSDMLLSAYFQLAFWLDSLLERSVTDVTALYLQAFWKPSVATAMNESPNFAALLPVLEFIFLFKFSYRR